MCRSFTFKTGDDLWKALAAAIFPAWAAVEFRRISKNWQSNLSAAKTAVVTANASNDPAKAVKASAFVLKWGSKLNDLVLETDETQMPALNTLPYALSVLVLLVEAEKLPGGIGVHKCFKSGSVTNGPQEEPPRPPMTLGAETERMAVLAADLAKKRARDYQGEGLGTGRRGQRAREAARSGFSDPESGSAVDLSLEDSFQSTATSLHTRCVPART